MIVHTVLRYLIRVLPLWFVTFYECAYCVVLPGNYSCQYVINLTSQLITGCIVQCKYPSLAILHKGQQINDSQFSSRFVRQRQDKSVTRDQSDRKDQKNINTSQTYRTRKISILFRRIELEDINTSPTDRTTRYQGQLDRQDQKNINTSQTNRTRKISVLVTHTELEDIKTSKTDRTRKILILVQQTGLQDIKASQTDMTRKISILVRQRGL